MRRFGMAGVFAFWVVLSLVAPLPAAAQVSYEVRWAQAAGAEPPEPPQPLEAPRPQYTSLALKARIQGVVIVRAQLTSAGAVTDLEVLKGLPMGLTEATLEVLPHWRFPPGEEDREVVILVHHSTEPAPRKKELDTPEGARAWLDRMAGLQGTAARECPEVGRILLQLPEWFSPHPANLSVFEEFALQEEALSSWLARLHLATSRGQDPLGYLADEVLEEMCTEAPLCVWCLGVQDALRAEEPIPEPLLAGHLEGVQEDLEASDFFAGKALNGLEWEAGGDNHARVKLSVGTSRQHWYLSRCQGQWRPVCRDTALRTKTIRCFAGGIRVPDPPQGQDLTPTIP